MRYDVILFDLDGTLVASAPGIFRSARMAVDQMGYTGYDPAVFTRFIGPPLYSSFQEHFDMDGVQAEEAVRRFRTHYEAEGLFDCAAYSGIPNLLRRLRAGGARLYVASAKNQVSVNNMLDYLNLTGFFDGAIGAAPDHRSEDKSAMLRAALPADARRAVMIGDRRFDMEAARACGIDAIGVGYGYGEREELEAAGAARVVDSVAELSDCLAGDVPQPQGLFVTVEGLDGSGKTTQIDRMAAHLTRLGYDILHTREPGGSPIAEKIRHMVLSPENLGMHAWTEALLYAAARAEHVRAVVRPALEAGRVVLCDRFVDSSVAYQGAGRELGIDRVLEINAPAVEGTAPDLTLYLRLDARTAMQRRAGASELDRIEMEHESFHQRVWAAYEELTRRDPGRIRAIDATQSVEDIAAAACAELNAVLVKR